MQRKPLLVAPKCCGLRSYIKQKMASDEDTSQKSLFWSIAIASEMALINFRSLTLQEIHSDIFRRMQKCGRRVAACDETNR